MKRLWLAGALLIAFTFVVEAQSTSNVVKRKQDQWMSCLKGSFRVNRKQTVDPNLAAEMAFRACSTEGRGSVGVFSGCRCPAGILRRVEISHEASPDRR